MGQIKINIMIVFISKLLEIEFLALQIGPKNEVLIILKGMFKFGLLYYLTSPDFLESKEISEITVEETVRELLNEVF